MTQKWNKLAEDIFLEAVRYAAEEFGKQTAEKFNDQHQRQKATGCHRRYVEYLSKPQRAF